MAGGEAAEGGPVVEAVRVVLTGGGGSGTGEELLVANCWGPEDEDATTATAPSCSPMRCCEDEMAETDI